jgi:hypothetical protein
MGRILIIQLTVQSWKLEAGRKLVNNLGVLEERKLMPHAQRIA